MIFFTESNQEYFTKTHH